MKIDEKRINKETNKVEICTEIVYSRGGIIVIWEDYEAHFLHTRMGMDSGSNRVHTLQHFIDGLDKDKSAEKEGPIFDSDIRAFNLGFMINALKQLMGTASSSASKETTKIYMKYVREAINLLEEAIVNLERIKENDYE